MGGIYQTHRFTAGLSNKFLLTIPRDEYDYLRNRSRNQGLTPSKFLGLTEVEDPIFCNWFDDLLQSGVIDKVAAGYDPETIAGQVEDELSDIVNQRANTPGLGYID